MNKTITVPELTDSSAFVEAVLDRALAPVDITAQVLFERESFGALVGIHSDAGSDMRRLLKAADGAVFHAADAGADSVALEHVVRAARELGPAAR